MPIDSLKFDPIDYYNNILKNDFEKNVDDQLNQYIKESNIDIEKDSSLTKEIKNYNETLKKEKKRLNRFKILKGFIIFFIIISAFFAVFGLLELVLSENTYPLFGLIALPVGLVIFITLILILFIVVNKKVKNQKIVVRTIDQKLKEKINENYENLYPLISHFGFKDFIKIINKTTSIFSIDEELKPEKLAMLVDLYQYNKNFDEDTSVLEVFSGNIDTNPFIKVKTVNKYMYNHVYSNSRVVTWTETYRDSNGNYRTRTCSDTITATITKPAPSYNQNAFLVYGNNAADKLTFSRGPSGIHITHDEKDIEDFVKNKEKDLERMNEKAIKKGETFQSLANSKFEILFGAYNRNNEQQYRLLFTPLAQQNMVEIITNKCGFGDDFTFIKENKLNIIRSDHSLNYFNFNEDTFNNYYTLESITRDYKIYLNNLFKSIYFDLAPLLAIPLYQMTDAGKYEPESIRHISDYEAEAMVNNMDQNLFKHEETDTPQILKISFNRSVNDTDIFNVCSYSFKKIPHVTTKYVTARNGRSYPVNVHWIEYFPLTAYSTIGIKDYSYKKKLEYSKKHFLYERENSIKSLTRNKNLLGFYINSDYNYNIDEDNQLKQYLDNEFLNY